MIGMTDTADANNTEMKTKVQRILYTPPRGIGDLVFSLPLLHSLQAAYPDAQIHVPIPRDKQEILDLVGFLKTTEQYLPKPKDDSLARERWQASLRGDRKEKWRLEKLIYEKYLAGEEFDLALIPRDFRIEGINCSNQICETDLANNGISTANLHMVDRFLSFADYLSIEKLMKFDLGINKEKEVCMSSGWKMSGSRPYIVLNLASSIDKKLWTEQGYLETANWCLANDLNVILIGDKTSYNMSMRIQAEARGVLNTVLNEGYAFTLKNIAVLASRALAFVSPDTGVLHIADAVGARVIGLYGPTNPAIFSPYNNKDNVISRFDFIDQDVKRISSTEVIDKLRKISVQREVSSER